MQKKLLAGIIAILIIVAGTSIASAASFPDVQENSSDYGAVEYLKTKGIVSGYPDGTFKPANNINRAEALKIVMLASGKEKDSAAKINFPDVKSTDWFNKFVRSAYELDIVDGYPDGTFRPASNINLAETLKLVLLSFDAEVAQKAVSAPYPDVRIADWYAAFAAYSKTHEFIWPQDDGKLNAARKLTRGEFAQIIYRLVYTEENNLAKFPINKDWQTFTNSANHYTVKYPFGWQKIIAGNDLIIWKADQSAGQNSFARTYPNGATVVISRYENPDHTPLSDYVNKLSYFKNGITQFLKVNNFPFANISIPEKNMNDYFFELPDKSIVTIYSEVGDGANKEYLQEMVRNMVISLGYTTQSGNAVDEKEQFLSAIREQIMVEGAGESVTLMFTDLIIIETDTIGIGTGPIDYRYSAKYDVTLKMERNSKTILAISSGKNTAF